MTRNSTNESAEKVSMDAHPMLTPMLPLQSPVQVAAEYPADAAAAYALIWNNTLGHLRGSQTASEVGNTYQVGHFHVGVRALWSVDAIVQALAPELDGLRVAKQAVPVGVRQDLPSAEFQIEVVDACFVPSEGREADTAGLIRWMDALQVASPGRLGEIVGEIAAEAWIRLDGDQWRLTDGGQAQLSQVDQACLTRIDGLATARWRDLVSAYLSNGTTLEQLVDQSNLIFGTEISLPCDDINELVAGEHTSDEAYALRDQTALKADSGQHLPSGMDPQLLLPADDPLRAERDHLEAALTQGRAHQWLCLSRAERAAIRMGAILSTISNEGERKLFCASVVFDARARWRVGLGADSSPPSAVNALRSFAAWSRSFAV